MATMRSSVVTNWLRALISGIAALWLGLLAAEVPAVPGTSWDSLPETKLEGNKLETARHILTLDASGLPAQIVIKPDQRELPLANRGKRAKPPTDAELQAIGRGPQLRAPLRIQANTKGRLTDAKVTQPAKPALAEGEVTCTSKLAIGSATLTLSLTYERDGALYGTLSCEGKGTKVESLTLVAELHGTVDTVVPGAPVQERLRAYPASEFVLREGDGLIWGNALADAKQGGRAAPGLVTHLFVGSGDRGFTWLTKPDSGWIIDKKVSSVTLERDQAGQTTWRIHFVNSPTKLKANRSASFALLTHPATFKPADHRRQGWINWPKDATSPGKALPLTLAGRQSPARASQKLASAVCATAYESLGEYALLSGAAGGDALSKDKNHAETWPIGLFKYLAGTHTGLTVRLRSNSADLIQPGMSRAADRVLIGRAFLHDIGLDASRLAHLGDAAGVVKAIRDFGLFETDGQTQFVPYWRTGPYLRFGEEFSKDDVFELDEESPVASVYTSVYLRPGNRGRGRKALIAIVNESSKPVRDQLYILSPGKLFGGANRLDRKAVISQYDFTALPDTSDWGKPGLLSRAIYRTRVVLKDLEDDGIVGQPASKRGLETYGPLIHVPAYSFRLLYGTGSP